MYYLFYGISVILIKYDPRICCFCLDYCQKIIYLIYSTFTYNFFPLLLQTDPFLDSIFLLMIRIIKI